MLRIPEKFHTVCMSTSVSQQCAKIVFFCWHCSQRRERDRTKTPLDGIVFTNCLRCVHYTLDKPSRYDDLLVQQQQQQRTHSRSYFGLVIYNWIHIFLFMKFMMWCTDCKQKQQRFRPLARAHSISFTVTKYIDRVQICIMLNQTSREYINAHNKWRKPVVNL